jgi:PAS domain S-box-containing protein
MTKGKASRRPDKPEKPAARGPRTAGEARACDASFSATQPVWTDVVLAVLLLLALGATAFIWFDEPPLAPRAGLLLTGIVWAVSLIGLLGRLHARRTVGRLSAILAHDQIVSARLRPDITEEQSGLRMRHVPAWLVAALGIAATAVIWQAGAVERVAGRLSTLLVGATVSVVLALAVAANAINRLKARRLARDFRAALNSERLALETLGALDVMISACLPTGERTRFNENFLKFVGKNAAQMQGRGWLEVVHPEDRQGALELVARPALNARARERDLCVRHHGGDYVWLHETLVPRFDDKGGLIEFIGTAIDITQRIETETSLDKQIGDLKTDLSKVQSELAGAKAELAETKTELSKAKVSRNRFESTLAESREEVRNLREALDKAEAGIAETDSEAAARIKEAQAGATDRVKEIEEAAESRIRKLEKAAEDRVSKLDVAVKSARQEHQQAALENKKLMRAFEKLQAEMGQLRLQDGAMREQIARHMKENREAEAVAAEAQKSEAQHRVRSDRLNQRCEELAAQVAAKHAALTAAQNQADQAGASSALQIERRLHEVSAEALATQLRKQLDDMQRMLGELMETTLDGPVRDAAHNTAATARAMSDLVDQALKGRGAGPPSIARSAAGASFDLRRTAEGVRGLLATGAGARGVKLEVELAPNLRVVHGDDIEIRTTLMSLTDAALHLVDDGTLTIRLSEDGSTGAHSTIRCELAHPSARVKTDALEAALGINSTDKAMPDAIKHPVAYQAAKAWRTIRRLQGQHGFQLPVEGGFSVWFTFTLERPAASASLRPVPSALPAPAHGTTASPVEKTAPESNATRPMLRMPTEFLYCNLGEVVELGTDSIRVLCAKPPKDNEARITFNDVDTDSEFRAEVTWSKKIAGRKHDVGLRLLGLTQAEQQWMLRTAMQHRKVTTMRPEVG